MFSQSPAQIVDNDRKTIISPSRGIGPILPYAVHDYVFRIYFYLFAIFYISKKSLKEICLKFQLNPYF